MKKNLTISLFLSISFGLLAQQDPLYSQYINNLVLINPAYSGFNKDFRVSATYRKQWMGLDGSPVTMNVNAHIALADNRMGVGLIMLQDKIGTDKTTEVSATYAYHVPLNDDLNLLFGLQGGAVNYKSDFDDLTISPDTKFTNVSQWKPNLGAGLILHSDKFMVAFSVPKMLKASSVMDQVSTALYNQHAYGLITYLLPLTSKITFKPWILTRIVSGAPLSMDYALSINVEDKYGLGVLTRDLNTYGAFAKINVGDRLRLAYVFELPTKKSIGIRFTTHEFTVGFRLSVFDSHELYDVQAF
jgi:type IX secretion system PorP/SprF family membrane protein